jgi:hypothetical protein
VFDHAMIFVVDADSAEPRSARFVPHTDKKSVYYMSKKGHEVLANIKPLIETTLGAPSCNCVQTSTGTKLKSSTCLQ